MGNLLCGCCSDGKGNSALYEPLLQENEREAVTDLLEFLENRTDTLFFEGEPLRALTTLSYSNNPDLQRSAALAFAEITERSVEEVDVAVLEPLLFLLRESTDPETQRAASAALGNLAVNVPNKLKIVRIGGLDPLVRQMGSANVEVQCNAVGCITNLATHEDNKSAVARSGALAPLIRLAKQTRDIRVQRNATGALLNMTHSEENRRELVEAGAIPVLIALLKSTDVDVVYYCTTALSNLAVDGGNRWKMQQEPRLVSELMELMQSPSLKIQGQSALCLRNLASDEQYQLEIARHPQGLPRLLALITNSDSKSLSSAAAVFGGGSSATGTIGGGNSPAAAVRHPQLVLAAVACIRNISIHPQNESKIIESGFLGPLVDLLASDNEEVQCHAISTLRNLAAGTSTSTLSSTSNSNSTSNSTSTSNTPSSPTSPPAIADNKQKIVESGALERIQRLLDQSFAATATAAANSRGGKEVAGVASAAKPRLGWSVVSEMTACVAVLALSEQLKPKLLCSGIIHSLIPLTKPSIPSEVQGNAAAAIGNLATKAKDMSAFLGDWEPICAYLERFMEPIPSHGTHYHELDDASATFQHIAIWTLLQFSESGGEAMRKRLLARAHLMQLVRNLQSYTTDEEVIQLTGRTLRLLGVEGGGSVGGDGTGHRGVSSASGNSNSNRSN